MKNFIYIILFILVTTVKTDENKPPELDLRNFNGTINSALFNSGYGNLIPDGEDENSIRIFDFQIDEIKENSKNFSPMPIDPNDVISIHTNFGLMQFQFYYEESPQNSLNFKKLANSKFYDKTLFHYVVPKFIIQGGDILTRNENKNDDGQGGPGWVIDAEYSDLKHSKGTLSMVRTPSNPNSAGSQFFISLSENKNLDNKYTVFGYLVDGEHILSRISQIISENGQAKLLCDTKIPSNENYDDWVELWDPLSKTNLFSKVQEGYKKDDFKDMMQERLNNIFRPGIPVIVDSIRVNYE